MNDNTKWSPGARSSTPGPTSVTIPAPSCPPSTGKPIIGIPPVTRWWSEWHMPAASIWILTSSLWGSPISISSMDHGWLNSQISAPLVFTANLLSSLNRATNGRLAECMTAGRGGGQELEQRPECEWSERTGIQPQPQRIFSTAVSGGEHPLQNDHRKD